MSKFQIFLFSLLFLLTAACSQSGSTEYRSTEISLSPFEKVHLTGGANLHIIPSDTYYVELKGLGVSGTDVEVKDGRLILENKGSSKRQSLDIYIYTQHLTGIEITGGGTVNVEEGFGSAERFDCNIMGGGKLALEAMEIGSLNISIMGGGAITALVENDISATIVGGGSIKYLGDPQVKSHILGGGAIKKM